MNNPQDFLEKVQKITLQSKENTHRYIRLAYAAQKDIERKNRLKSNLCIHCFYLMGAVWAGAAMTKTNCSICGKELIFGSTEIDKICTDCAKKHRLCKDIDYKQRRKI